MKHPYFVAVAALMFAIAHSAAQPTIDYHQHLLSPSAAALGSMPNPVDAKAMITLLDEAGVRKALVLSLAYQFGNPNRPPVKDEYEKEKAENDWTARQVAQYPNRLRAFCGVDPLKDYALAEITRCAKDPYLRLGLKLHFGNSDVDLDSPAHVSQLRKVFKAANQQGMAIAVHLHSSVTKHRAYGAKEARVFLNEILPSAPDITIQIAHLAGSGGYDDPSDDEALSVFIDAIKDHDPRMTHVYFDISGVAGLGKWEEKKSLIATSIRQVGIRRILWGSDGSFGGGMTPLEALRTYRQLPLTAEEFRIIEANVAPYMQ
jgi:uncharacterized protein